ncbi:uncharacterized protein BDZ99DRAFT_459656 [Mytilinidion resinicola]|uniref:Uncharacterized protein n=1 Tax=Mytilinidion resinicola TaxID=574789 RepID=A0A6A6YZI8_9PEZI|nr:uncharacterized protein BDZ99DRAFT_459656 [Mytilinidion resinicola]KAF2813909.1 hypothetical protein BDZ99DRAFT_459656 [Mytilinidion resinicola]
MPNPSTVLEKLQVHLREVEQEPTTSLDVHLLGQCELYVSQLEFPNGGWRQTHPLFLQLGQLLPSLQQDPSPLIRFVLKLTAPYSFDEVKELDFAMGLNLKAEPFHLLILTLLEKATATGNDAENLASRSDVVKAIVRLWLCTEDTGTATKASNLLIALLSASKNLPGGLNEIGVGEYGRGAMWKRLFEDKDIYSLLYLFCSLKSLPAGDEVPLNKRNTTVAQARLMDWLPKVGALDWDTIVRSHHPEIETKVGLRNGEGLLHFASMKMVDFLDDILMHISLINFFSDLISTVKTIAAPTSSGSSVALDFLKKEGWHAHIIKYQQDDTPSMERTFLKAPAANYISAYASTYLDDFERSPEAAGIVEKLNETINKAQPEDFHILSSVPRASLVPQRAMGYAWDESPILSIPIRLTSADALKTLATIFHGPIEPDVVFPLSQISLSSMTVQTSSARFESERIYARLLLSLYLTKTPSFFTEIIRHADTIAMKENAIAALILLRAIITAKWSPASQLNDGNSDAILTRLQNFPDSGLELILDPTISGGVLPFLLKPATTFSGLVGGRGDAESAAFQVAMTKFDVLKVLGERVKELQPPRSHIDGMIRRRVAEGPWGVGQNAAPRIGTMEL